METTYVEHLGILLCGKGPTVSFANFGAEMVFGSRHVKQSTLVVPRFLLVVSLWSMFTNSLEPI